MGGVEGTQYYEGGRWARMGIGMGSWTGVAVARNLRWFILVIIVD